MNLQKLLTIKDSPLEDLPSVSVILDTVLKITEINPSELLVVLGSKENNDFCMFKPDVFLKVATYAEGLNYEAFVVFSEQVRSAIRNCAQGVAVVHKFPLWFCKIHKNNYFMLAGLPHLLEMKKEYGTINLKDFTLLHPEFFTTPELNLFMSFLCQQLLI